MIEIKLDGLDALKERVDNMAEQVEHLKRVDLGNELSDWQTEDLHRNRPFTMRSRAKGRAATVISRIRSTKCNARSRISVAAAEGSRGWSPVERARRR